MSSIVALLMVGGMMLTAYGIAWGIQSLLGTHSRLFFWVLLMAIYGLLAMITNNWSFRYWYNTNSQKSESEIELMRGRSRNILRLCWIAVGALVALVIKHIVDIKTTGQSFLF